MNPITLFLTAVVALAGAGVGALAGHGRARPSLLSRC